METPELLRHLICPICREYINKTHYICNNSHRFCEDCINYDKDKLTVSCCVCKQSELDIKTDQLVPEIYHFFNIKKKCENAHNGCNETIHMKDYETHLKTCKFNQIKCIKAQCNHMFSPNDSLSEILQHFNNKHKFLIVNHNYTINCLVDNNYVIPISDDIIIMVFIETYTIQNNYLKIITNTSIVTVKMCAVRNSPIEGDYSFVFDGKDYSLNNENDYSTTITTTITKYKELPWKMNYITTEEINKIVETFGNLLNDFSHDEVSFKFYPEDDSSNSEYTDTEEEESESDED